MRLVSTNGVHQWLAGSPLGILVALLTSACMTAEKAPPPTGAAPPPPPPTPTQQSVSDVDALQHDLDVSEGRLIAHLSQRQVELATRGDADRDRATEAEAGEAKPKQELPAEGTASSAAPREDRDQKPPADEAAANAQVGTSCDLACRALNSMRRAADGICDITGQADTRCENARRRVNDAKSRIEQARCACVSQ